MPSSVGGVLFRKILLLCAMLLISIVATGSTKKVSAAAESGSINIVSSIPNVDMQKVRETWLSWHNQERKLVGKPAFALNNKLNFSANVWAEYMKKINSATHKRKASDGYYSYNSIKNRLEANGVQFDYKQGTLYSESIGRGYYSCKKTDCTQDFIKAIKSTYNFFMSEKGRSQRPHYNAIVSKSFINIGVGISWNPKNNKYFLTTHYTVAIKK